MHRGQKLELRLWGSRLLSWVPLGETAAWFREVLAGLLSLLVKNEHERTQKSSKLNRIKSDPDRNRPQGKKGRTARLCKIIYIF